MVETRRTDTPPPPKSKTKSKTTPSTLPPHLPTALTASGSARTATTGHILVVDDEPNHAEITAEILEREGHRCKIVTTGQAGLRQLKTDTFDLIITDLRMKDVDGMELLDAVKSLHPDTEVIMLTGYGTVDAAVQAMERGAFTFIAKPANMDELRAKVAQALERAALRRENEELRQFADEKYGFEGIVGNSPPMRKVFDTLRAVAPTNATVLITGEPGTGKELIAKAIHNLSPRRTKRFVPVNCAELEGTLLQSKLFGHIRGSYTGADRDQEGMFEYAAGGTLFLDEIGDMPLETQAQLLRVLESKQIRRLGDNKLRDVDVRVVAATNRDLDSAVREGRFREDLYSRIRTFRLHLPPLHQRQNDIPLLAQKFLREYAAEFGKNVAGFAPDALNRLKSHRYTSNVRDLQSVVQRAVLFASQPEITHTEITAQIHETFPGDPSSFAPSTTTDETFSPPDAAPHSTYPTDGVGKPHDPLAALVGVTLEQAEIALIRNTLHQMSGNREKTAKSLGISERTLYRKIKEYNLA